MSADDWGGLQVLKREGAWFNWGDPDRIAREVVMELDRALVFLKLKALVTWGTTGKHSPNSWHYPKGDTPGSAIDFMLPGVDRTRLPDVMIDLLRFEFKGIGIYNDWKLSRDGKELGGFHVEWNDKPHRALWLRTKDGDLAVTTKNLRQAFSVPT